MLLLAPLVLDRLLSKARAIQGDDQSRLRSVGFEFDWEDNLRVGYDHEFGLFVLAGHVLIWTSIHDCGDYTEIRSLVHQVENPV